MKLVWARALLNVLFAGRNGVGCGTGTASGVAFLTLAGILKPSGLIDHMPHRWTNHVFIRCVMVA
jgi:hypothetical protein